MKLQKRSLRAQSLFALGLFSLIGIASSGHFLLGQVAASAQKALEASFDQIVTPFFKQNCLTCHNADLSTAGIRVDQLDARLGDRHLQTWEAIRRKIHDGSMPPKGMPQPSSESRQKMVEWITQALETARLRPSPKNGLIRRLTVSQYRNTLRELLLLDDDLTMGLPPDAVSKDGFVNNKDTLQLPPVLTEAYFEIAEEALNRVIVDPKSKPAIQNFRVDLGANVNASPIREKLILGAGSALLPNEDVLVTQLEPKKPFPFDPFFMRTKYRFIEGYQGNDTVRGWREFDSIYHAVFADMRGSPGYPKGEAHSVVPQGLLLRPAIPNDENFGVNNDSTYGPKANFKISLRELPDDGRFRITVTAAKYNDGLLLGPNTPPKKVPESIPVPDPKERRSITIPRAGIYQVDIYRKEHKMPAPDVSRLGEALAGSYPLDGEPAGILRGQAKFVDSPFGKAVSLAGNDGSVVIPRTASMNVGEGEFTVAAWIHPRQLRKAGIAVLRAEGTQGWYLDLSDNRGTIRFDTNGPDKQPNGSLSSPPGVIRVDAWQHVAAVIKRARQGEHGRNEARLYVNGYVVARGEIGPENLDNPKLDFTLGRIGDSQPFDGDLDEIRIYRRALDEAEIQGLLQPGKQFVQQPTIQGPGRRAQDIVTLTLGDREFSGAVQQSAFLAVRLEAGALLLRTRTTGLMDVDRLGFCSFSDGGERFHGFFSFPK